MTKTERSILKKLLTVVMETHEEAWSSLESDDSFWDAAQEMLDFIEADEEEEELINNEEWDLDGGSAGLLGYDY